MHKSTCFISSGRNISPVFSSNAEIFSNEIVVDRGERNECVLVEKLSTGYNLHYFGQYANQAFIH